MRVSTQFPLAVHCMLWIAGFPQHKATSEVLAESTGSNAAIIRSLFAKLNHAGLLITKSGKGKTVLARSAEEITLWDIYTAVESPDTDDLFKCHTNMSEVCPVGVNIHGLLYPHLDKAVAAMRRELEQVTLGQLRDELYQKMIEQENSSAQGVAPGL